MPSKSDKHFTLPCRTCSWGDRSTQTLTGDFSSALCCAYVYYRYPLSRRCWVIEVARCFRRWTQGWTSECIDTGSDGRSPPSACI